MTRVKQVGDRIEEILVMLRSAGGHHAVAAEELPGLLVEMYGDGLGHIVAILACRWGRVSGRGRRRSQAAAGGELPWLPVVHGHRAAGY